MNGLSGIAVKILLKNLAKTRTYLYWLLCQPAVEVAAQFAHTAWIWQ